MGQQSYGLVINSGQIPQDPSQDPIESWSILDKILWDPVRDSAGLNRILWNIKQDVNYSVHVANWLEHLTGNIVILSHIISHSHLSRIFFCEISDV